ncbi:hypothetical protein GGR57DRAFT_499890 [Xylariaceae sp. FL1272]|nr:hypothetical protein GGR57DRAFT_499890 [Xylariaceae sp. FL1272]
MALTWHGHGGGIALAATCTFVSRLGPDCQHRDPSIWLPTAKSGISPGCSLRRQIAAESTLVRKSPVRPEALDRGPPLFPFKDIDIGLHTSDSVDRNARNYPRKAHFKSLRTSLLAAPHRSR